jgi:hypothetical protein
MNINIFLILFYSIFIRWSKLISLHYNGHRVYAVIENEEKNTYNKRIQKKKITQARDLYERNHNYFLTD